MAIQTIGGAAASTGVQGTPILNIQRATPSQAGVSSGFQDSEQLMEYTLTNPLPPGNYFFTFFASGNAGAQVILGLDNGTILGQASSNGSTSTIATSVAVGRTLSKIWFRKGPYPDWATTISLNATISTDSANFYGYKKTQAISQSFSLPPIPSGYTKVSNNNYINASQVSLDGTKTYFVVMRTAAKDINTTNYASNFGAEHNTNMNSALKFYEYNLITGVLTEKAQPVFNASTTCGLSWNPSSYQNAYISHLYQSYCLVATDYVYFDPGVASLSATGGYSGEYPYAQMGKYNISANTWSTAYSGRASGLQGLQPSYGGWTTAGNNLVFTPSWYYRNAYNTADSINLYQYNWYTQYSSNSALVYKHSANSWTNVANQRSTSSYNIPRSYGATSPASDRYVMFDTSTDALGTASTQTMYFLDTESGTFRDRYYTGFSAAQVSDPSGGGATATMSPYGWNTNAWFRDPTNSKRVYIAPYANYPYVNEFFLLDFGDPSLGTGLFGSGTSSSTYINYYFTKTKWKVNQPPKDYYGILYVPSLDKLIQITQSINPNTSTTQTVKLGYDLVPFPDALASY